MPQKTKQKEPLKRLVAKIPASLSEQLERDSDAEGAPVSSIVRRALEEYYKKRGLVFDVTVKWGNPQHG